MRFLCAGIQLGGPGRPHPLPANPPHRPLPHRLIQLRLLPPGRHRPPRRGVRLGHQLLVPKARVSRLEGRLPVLERRFPVLDRRLSVLERRLPVLERRLPVLERRFPVLERRRPVLGRRIPGADCLSVLRRRLPSQSPVFDVNY
jgi:hypothetical protein